MKINKTKLNLNIDLIMFIVMMAVAGIGFLIRFVLVPGFKRNEIYGTGVELYYLGLDRHQWGTVHLILSFSLLFLLVLHIVFHWKQIVGNFKRMVSDRKWRIVLTSLFVSLSVLLGIMPLFVEPEIREGVPHHNKEKDLVFHRAERVPKNTLFESHECVTDTKKCLKSNSHQGHSSASDVVISGNMSLNEVAKKYNIPADKLASCICVPLRHNDEKIGRLRKRYGFHLNDLRDYIEKNR